MLDGLLNSEMSDALSVHSQVEITRLALSSWIFWNHKEKNGFFVLIEDNERKVLEADSSSFHLNLV